MTKRDFIISMAIKGMDFTRTVEEYAKRGVIVYERVLSSVYSRRMLEAFGLMGAIRVSPLHCHGIEDIDKFLRITRELAERL